MIKIILMAIVWCLASGTALLQQAPTQEEKSVPQMHDCPIEGQHAHMNERGAAGMGFSQSTTEHHFLIQAGGGVIVVEAKNLDDTAARDSIRHHLKHIAKAFANADFDIPMFVHDTTPPGVPEMKQLRQKITYSFQETAAGGQVLIRATDRQALTAVHKFLKYQIEEHQTGDLVELPSDR
jgi:hypothetical protein